MLKKVLTDYNDGTRTVEIVHIKDGEQYKIYPQRDKIKNCIVGTFLYRIPKHDYLPITIVNLNGKKMIMPTGIECHPETTLDDVKEIVKRKNKKREKKQLWKFNSSSGGGTYTVQKVGDILRCNCPGVWRTKDRRCKHIKEVEKL